MSAVERSYRDVTTRRFHAGDRPRVQRSFSELRIDLARLSDELSNITKFFGDWHLARIYQLLSARFHLGDWHRTVDDKLKTLDELYQLLHKHDQNNRWMLILEAHHRAAVHHGSGAAVQEIGQSLLGQFARRLG